MDTRGTRDWHSSRRLQTPLVTEGIAADLVSVAKKLISPLKSIQNYDNTLANLYYFGQCF